VSPVAYEEPVGDEMVKNLGDDAAQRSVELAGAAVAPGALPLVVPRQ